MILNNDFIYFLIFCLINEKVGIEDMLKFEPQKYGMLRALLSVKMRKLGCRCQWGCEGLL